MLKKITEKEIELKFGEMPEEVRALFYEKKYDDCAIECEKILSSDPHAVLARLYLGTIFESRKEYEKAIAHYSLLIEYFPNFTLFYGMKGLAQFEIGDYKGTKDSFVKYIDHNDRDTTVWSIVAKLENSLSGRRSAMQILDEAERRTTENQDLLFQARGFILRPTDPDSALLYFLKAQETAKDKKQKEKYGKEIYQLILKNTDPLRRSNINTKKYPKNTA